MEGEGKGIICGFTLSLLLPRSIGEANPDLSFLFFFFFKIIPKAKKKAGEAEVAGTVAACLGGRGEGKGICGLPFPLLLPRSIREANPDPFFSLFFKVIPKAKEKGGGG